MVLQSQMVVLLLVLLHSILGHLHQSPALESANSLPTTLATLESDTYRGSANNWQPVAMSMPMPMPLSMPLSLPNNNWIILPANTRADSSQPPPTYTPFAYRTIFNEKSPSDSQLAGRPPVDYYALNQSSGFNYQLPKALHQPYTASAQKRSATTTHLLPLGGSTRGPDNSVKVQKEEEKSDPIVDQPPGSVKPIREILVPLRSGLEMVKQFCDVVKDMISNDDDDDNDNDNDDDSDIDGDNPPNSIDGGSRRKISNQQTTTGEERNEADLDNSPSNKMLSSARVQGRQGDDGSSATERFGKFIKPLTASPSSRSSSSSSSSSSSLSLGTGRKVKKIKKKFKKYMLPLLIAYKLKFLTLIPVLIGGLTLLVGTTGLAGFFFALFTAVMSLKGTGHGKSIVVKKF